MPKIVLGIAAALLVIGAAILIFWLTGAEFPTASLLATDTPTPTETLTPSPVPPTATASTTPTQAPPTDTLEPTLTPTLSGPVIYVAQEGDSLSSIADRFQIDILVLLELNRERLNLDPGNPIIRVGDEVLIPAPNTELPTSTPLPEGLPRGTRIEYMVRPGDTLELIALEFNSTVEDILEENEDLEDPNAIFVGQILTIRVNLVTPVPTEEGQEEAPESTPGSIATLTPEATETPGN
jgi:LysM repeat protein